MRIIRNLMLLFVLFSYGCDPNPPAFIYIDPNADKIELFAAREIRKYIYLRTGELLPIVVWDQTFVFKGDAFVVGSLAEQIELPDYNIPALNPDEYILKTIEDEGGKILLVYGGNHTGTLYAAYHLAECWGVGFFLEGDVIPDKQVPFILPELEKYRKPLFMQRGILPFHDFPEGPDWWNLDDYKAIIGQLPKLGMNFIGFHTYTQDPKTAIGGAEYEPMVWIGTKSNIAENGKVNMSYPSSHFTTSRGHKWSSYETMYTSEYYYGVSQLFEKDDFGADYMMAAGTGPASFIKQNQLFNAFGSLQSDAFTYAKRLGVKTCLGTETPLTIPEEVRKYLKSQGKDYQDPDVVQEVYEGIFERIKATHPLDYYWIWTPEIWMTRASDQEVHSAILDLKTAVAAAELVNVPFTLGTCGWVLGPPEDRILFDKVLPKGVVLSAINAHLGKDPVQAQFSAVQGRPKWAIPWLEDDPALTIPQLWAGRMRKDAADAFAYGCTGLLGIHWRTRILSPNVASLSKAAWDQNGWNPDFPNRSETSSRNGLNNNTKSDSRDFPVDDFYSEWARINFGEEVVTEIAKIFINLDGVDNSNEQKVKIPRPATWRWGPGGIRPDSRSWEEVRKEYQFVGDMESLRSSIVGAGNLERFDYWLNQFKYIRAMGELNCVWALYEKEIEKIKASDDREKQKHLALNNALPHRIEMIKILEEVHNHLIACTATNGELGVICNWQQRILPKVFRDPGLILVKYLASALPENAKLHKEYRGAPHMIVTTIRGSLVRGDALNIKVRTISPHNNRPIFKKIYWKKPGEQAFVSNDLKHLSRGVYTYQIDPQEFDEKGIEYYIEMKFENGFHSKFPASAPNVNQIVSIMPQ